MAVGTYTGEFHRPILLGAKDFRAIQRVRYSA
ncbi:hypothetical protein LAUMK35_00717 [Mycobacterium pseudokansasii]|nr:hypothetical protein LAUMK35_00717 [Mycobacterium pseudokansasii]VAZ89413.1 hypothetical protein LAUMK21_00715 [Mycobacterium pseudokansasii]